MWPTSAFWPYGALITLPSPDPAVVRMWLVVTSAVAAYLGVQHFWLWLGRRQEKLDLLMAVFAFDACVFAAGHAALEGWTDDLHLEVILGRILIVSAVLVFSLFVVASSIIARTRWSRTGRAGFAAAHTAGVFLTIGTPLWITDDGYFTPLVLVWLLYLVWAFAFSLARLRRARTLSRTERWGLLAGLVVYAITGEFEVLQFYIRIPVEVFPYAFVGLAIAFDHLTIRRHNRLFSALKQEVAERTADLQHANLELARQAHTDPLTCIGNRQALREALDSVHAQATANGTPYGLAIFDIDNFKKYNDSLGHLAGDRVLARVAEVLSATCRGQDHVFRFGGEEFVLVVPGATATETMEIAERLRQAVEHLQLPHPGPQRTVTVSGGVYARECEDRSCDQVLALADGGLYAAKDAGRNCVRFGAAQATLEAA
ncbi:MAG: GGDEF domain-containing protein [Chloroflexi bacterium]|nr:GGDEF domain-containing protein [Chloroflexota bacterium]